MKYWAEIFNLEVKPHEICEKCKHCDSWTEREWCLTFYWCTKYRNYNYRCKRKCLKLKKGLLRQIKNAIKEIEK